MGNQFAVFKSSWVDEATQTLSRYNKSFTEKFMARHNLPVLPTKKEMKLLLEATILFNKGIFNAGNLGIYINTVFEANDRGFIKTTVLANKKHLTFKDLVEYIDELKMYGRQHVFLFTLKNDQEKYVEQLANPDYVRQRLHEHDLENRYNNHICQWEWKNKLPFLSEVKYIYGEKGQAEQLIYKWVETRFYWKKHDKKFIHEDERAVVFFIINLENGSSQLRIQLLQPNAGKDLEEEFNLYRKAIKQILEFDHFKTMPLLPAMKIFLDKRLFPLRYFSFKFPHDGIVKCSGLKAKLFLTVLKFLLNRMSPREIRLYWVCNQFELGLRRLNFILNAKHNAITFTAITDRLKVDDLVSAIRDLEFEIIVGVSLKKHYNRTVFGVICKKINESKLKAPETVKKITSGLIALSPMGLFTMMLYEIRHWMIKKIVENVMWGVPFIVLVILVYLFLIIFMFCKGRTKERFIKIPRKYITSIVRFVIPGSAHKIINSKKYQEWLQGHPYLKSERRQPGRVCKSF